MKKKVWLILFFLLLCGVITAFCYQKQREEEQAAAQAGQSEIAADENQTVQYGKITSVIGNEITIEYLEIKKENGRTEYASTGKSAEYQIPVGTQVETRLGSFTTFSRLSNGDTVALLLEEGQDKGGIMKIWIVG